MRKKPNKVSDKWNEKIDITRRNLLWGMIFVFVSGFIFGTLFHTLLVAR